MAGSDTSHLDPLAGLLADLDTIASEASAGFGSRREYRLEPGETRPAAILFLDVVGFTGLARKLNTEHLSRLIDRTFRIFDLTVRAEGGYCDKVIGDAGLYVFAGHPNFAPACEAALNCALAVRERIRRINTSLLHSGMTIAVRGGISFGEVTRQRIGGDAQQVTVMGEAVNLAQRLENTAAPGVIQTVQSVLAEVGEKFLSTSLGEVDLKGFGPQQVYSVDARREGPRLRSGAARLTPLVGRERILKEATALVQAWWSQAATGPAEPAAARLLVLRGPTAVGKSRLTLETLARLREHFAASGTGLACATTHCTEHTGLLEFAAEVCGVCGLTRENLVAHWELLTEQGRAAWGAERGAQLAAQLPLLAYILQNEQVDTLGIRQADSGAFSQACRLALKSCLELAGLQSDGRVILVVEDLQWLGILEETLCWLLTNCVPALPLVVIGTARPRFDASAQKLGALLGYEAAAADAAQALQNCPFAVLDVQPLTRAEGEELLQALLPGLELPPSVQAELHEKSLGLPYYYEEVARMLLAQGAVCESAGHYRATREIAGLDMPADFRMLILGRLDLLRPELRELAGHASVLGRSFRGEMLARLEAKVQADSAAGLLPEAAPAGAGISPSSEADKLPPRLATLVEGLVQERIFNLAEGGRINFEHLLTLEAAYSSLLQSNRSQLHAAAAEVLEEELVPGTAAERDILPVLASHLKTAGSYEEAHKYYCELMVLATGRRNAEEWEQWNRLAQETATATPPDKSAPYLRALGRQSLKTSDLQSAQIHLYAALANFDQQQGNRDLYSRILSDLGSLHASKHDSALAEGFFQQALQEARLSDSENLLCEAKTELGQLHYHLGRIELGVQYLEEAISHAESTANERRKAAILILLGSAKLDMNAIDQAKDHFSEALAISRRNNDLNHASVALGNLAVALQAGGQNESALECFEAAYRSDVQLKRIRGQAYNLMNMGNLYLDLNRLEEANGALEQALALFQAENDRWGSGLCFATLAETLIRLGKPEQARNNLELADELMRETDDSFRRGLLQCTWARLHLFEGNLQQVQHALAQAEAFNLHTGVGNSSFLSKQIRAIRESMPSPEARQSSKAQG